MIRYVEVHLHLRGGNALSIASKRGILRRRRHLVTLLLDPDEEFLWLGLGVH